MTRYKICTYRVAVKYERGHIHWWPIALTSQFKTAVEIYDLTSSSKTIDAMNLTRLPLGEPMTNSNVYAKRSREN